MMVDENLPSLPSHVSRGLTLIKGIGPFYARALYKIGIEGPADLAGFTPDRLSTALLEEAGVSITPARIEDWINQAKQLTSGSLTAGSAPDRGAGADTASARAVTLQDSAFAPADWHQYAGVSLFFDSMTDQHGKQTWHTRVYHDESGAEVMFEGTQADAWVEWILDHARLPFDWAGDRVSAAIAASATEPLSEPSAEEMVQLDVLDVRVSDVHPSAGSAANKLALEVQFRLSGPGAAALASAQAAYRIEIHAVDVLHPTTSLLSFVTDRLQPQWVEYTSRQECLMPDLGHYELHCIVLLLPPNERVAYHVGPVVEIVP
ncbi:MAG: hypothetical protein M1546_12290 [Chloroflexi bacterium]|nr:hypothetical protein [Chloroflexota bacterium]